VTVQASGQLMDDFVYATDLTGETDLTAIQQSDGTYSLLYLGSTGNIMSLRRDSGSDTGWNEEVVDATLQPSQVVGGIDASGQFTVFAIGSNVAAPDIHVMTRQGGGTWSAPNPVASDSSVPMFVQASKLAAFMIAGKLELFALLSPSPGSSGQSSLWRIDWDSAIPSWQYIADTDQTIIESCTIAGVNSLLFANTADATPVALDLFTVAAPFTATVSLLASSVVFRSLAVGTQADNNSAVFIADPGDMSDRPQIQYFDGSNPGAGFVVVDSAIKATALAVASAGANPLALFALDDSGALQFIAAPPSDTKFDFFLRLRNILTVRGTEGDAELIGYVPKTGLMRMWQSPPDDPDSPDGSKGGWNQEQIQYPPVTRKLVEQKTYSTTLTFYDAKGVTLSNAKVALRSTEIVTASIAGEVVTLGPARAMTFTTDAAGRLRVTTETRTLNAAGLSARLPDLMLDGGDFAVTPNHDVQERLRNITTAEVKRLVPGEFAGDADQIRLAVTEAMANIHDGPVALVRARLNARDDLRLPLPMRAQPRQPFRFTVAGGRAVFKTLTEAEADAAIAEIAARRSDPDFGFFDFFEDAIEAIGDAFESAVNAVYDYVIKPIATGFELAINWVADKLKIAWNGIVDTVESAFRFVETVFNAVKTFFVRLYNFLAWLLSDARKDIWATKRKFEQIFSQGLVSLAGYAADGSKVSHSFFETMEGAVKQAFAGIEKDLGKIDADDGIDAPSGVSTFLEIIEDSASVANWLMDKVSIGSLISLGINIPPAMVQDAMTLISQVQSTFATEIAKLIQASLKRLQALATSTSEFGKVLLATIIGEVKDLILAILRVLDSLVQSVLSFFAKDLVVLNTAVFGASINNFVIQALYDLINPGSSEDLTVVGLGSLLCAFVATTLYRIIFEDSPFSLEQAEQGLASSKKEIGVLLILSGLVQATVWCVADIGLDVGLFDDPPVWQVLAVVILGPTLIQLLAWPGGPGAKLAFDTPVAKATSAAWLAGFGGVAFKVLWSIGVVAGKLKGGPRGSFPGSCVLCAGGVLSMGMNAWMLSEKESAGTARVSEWVAGAAGPLSAIAKPAKHALDPVDARIFLGVMDLVSDVSAGIAKIVHGKEVIDTDEETMRTARRVLAVLA
jgi:hypothetical protein